MKKKAGTITYKWGVYAQGEPVFVGKDKTGTDLYRLNIEFVTAVSAKSSAEAWKMAKKITRMPSIEFLGVEQ